jgi:hypothetical protein
MQPAARDTAQGVCGTYIMRCWLPPSPEGLGAREEDGEEVFQPRDKQERKRDN